PDRGRDRPSAATGSPGRLLQAGDPRQAARAQRVHCPVRRRHAGNRRLEVGTERASRHTSHLDRRGQCLGTHCSRFEVVMAGANITGRSSPLGATVVDGGVNFSLFSRTATGVELLFFDREEDATPSRVVVIDPVTNRTYHYWHVFVPGVRSGQ